MRYLIVGLSLLMGPVTSADAQASVALDGPRDDVGVDVPDYPELVLVPGHPVYWAPKADWNYFFYDGVFWLFEGDDWYASTWYGGPWQAVRREYVPAFVLRVPVRYYRRPPPYFRGWSDDAPPRWGERWGRDWERRHAGWNRWDRRPDPRPAPLPTYQRLYSGDRYPHAAEQQYSIRCEYYRYEPRETAARELLRQREYMAWYPSAQSATRKWHAPGPQRGPHRGRPHRPERRGDRASRSETRRQRG